MNPNSVTIWNCYMLRLCFVQCVVCVVVEYGQKRCTLYSSSYIGWALTRIQDMYMKWVKQYVNMIKVTSVQGQCTVVAKSFENDTQIYIFIKSAASVSLDVFVRWYYGILKYNYKHFITVKSFYWQLHEVDAESVFAVLTLLFQDLCNLPWYAVN